ncbi:MAG: MFS transporter, partial [Dehalococcoidia bacterium]
MKRPFYGWGVVGVCSVVAFCTGPGQTQVFSVFIDPLIEDLGISRTLISALYMAGTAASAATVLGIGRLTDRFGGRRMLIAVALAFGLACLGMAAVRGPVTLALSFAALRALGQGSLSIIANLLVAQWFVRYRGRAVAIVWLGLSAASATLPPLALLLIDLGGWRRTYALLGLMVWVLIIPATLLVVRNRPEDLGLYPDGARTPPATERESESRGDALHPTHTARRVLRSGQFWRLAISLAAPAFVLTALLFHQTSIFAGQGLSAEVAAGVFPAFAVTAAGANTLAGILADRFGPKPVFLLTLGFLITAMLLVQVIATPLAALAYACILGTGSGMNYVVFGVIWAHYYGRQELGAVQGPATMVMTSGAAIAPLPLAVLYQLFGSYGPALTLLAVIPVICALVVATFKPAPAYPE